MAGALRNRGDGAEMIFEHLKLSNTKCDPPKPESELRDIAAWAAKQTVGDAWKTEGAPSDPDLNKPPASSTRRSIGEVLPAVPKFDLELLPFDLRAWVADIANRMQVPIDLPAVYAMSALSVVATSARTVKPKRNDPWRVYPILWGCGIAPPSSMKTPSMNEAIKPLVALEAKAREDFAKNHARRDVVLMALKAKRKLVEDRIKSAVKDGDSIDPNVLAKDLPDDAEMVPRPRRFFTNDSTLEKIQDLVNRGPKERSYPLGIVRDELIGMLNTFERDGREGDRAAYLEAWSVTDRSVDRVGRGEVFTKDLALVIFGSTTPGPFQAYVREACKSGGGADGLLQRFQLMVYPDPPTSYLYIDYVADRMAKARATAVFERLASIWEDDEDGKPPALHFCNEAQPLFERWLVDLSNRLLGAKGHQAVISHYGKYRSLMPAIALVYHLASGPGSENTPISVEAARAAIRWVDYLSGHAKRVYSIATDPYRSVAKAIEERILEGKLAGTVQRREIVRMFQAHEAKDVIDAIDLLEDFGWLRVNEVRPEKGSMGGRPRVEVCIWPVKVEAVS